MYIKARAVVLLFLIAAPHSLAFLNLADTDFDWDGGSDDVTTTTTTSSSSIVSQDYYDDSDEDADDEWSASLQREMEGITVTEGSAMEDGSPLESDHWRPLEDIGPPDFGPDFIPIEAELSQRIRAQLDTLAGSAHLAQPRFGLQKPLDPLVSSSSLKYVHEGELLKLRLVLENVTLEGINSLSVQEITFQRGQLGKQENEDEIEESQNNESSGGDAAGGKGDSRRGRRRNRGRVASSRGVVRVAFSNMVVRAKYQVRGSAGGFLSFREDGNLTLTAPSVFLTSRLSLFLPPPRSTPRSTTPHRRHGGRVKIARVRSEVTTPPTNLTINPSAHPPRWVRQQVQNKLEELSRYLSRQHGAVRRLLHQWGKLLKRIIHRTARSIH